jgi:hypothetical protein
VLNIGCGALVNLKGNGFGALGKLVSFITPNITPASNIITEIIIPTINDVSIYYNKKY